MLSSLKVQFIQTSGNLASNQSNRDYSKFIVSWQINRNLLYIFTVINRSLGIGQQGTLCQGAPSSGLEVGRYRLSSVSVITEDSSGQPLNNLSTTYCILVREKANGAKSVQHFQFTQQQLSLQTELETTGGR